jgi:PAN domain
LCKQKLEGLSVPGFTLKCDTLIPFGKMLGPVPVSQTASSLGDCAARCRKAETPRCVAFSFDAGAHVGAASCYLTGSIPGYNAAPNWIAGTR